MGSRGKFNPSYGRTGGIPVESREYSVVAMIGRIKVIQCDTMPNNPTPTYSNTANTVYFSFSKERGRIEHIYFYRNHRLVKSIDLDGKTVPHAHYWHTEVVGRKRHDKRNFHRLTGRDFRLLGLAMEFNGKQEFNKQYAYDR